MSHLSTTQLQKYSLSELKLVENRLLKLAEGQHAPLQDIVKYAFNWGGKRIRPLLVLLCSDIYRAQLKTRIDIATAAELIHTASLLHDDIVDDAHIRRGQASVNHQWSNSSSVLTGDYMFAQAFTILSKYPPAMEVMTDAIATMSQGELVQLHSHFDPNMTAATYVETIASKTASLVAACCKSGGLISTMPSEQVQALYRFGLHLGIAYQILDDIGDYTLDSTNSGKTQGKDLAQGVVTLPLIYLLRNPRRGSKIRQWLLQGALTPEMLWDDLGETGALTKSAKLAAEYLQAGIDILQPLPQSRATIILQHLAEDLQAQSHKILNYTPGPQSPGQFLHYSRP